MHASEGIEQGDAAGPALVACGLKTPLDELRSRLESQLSQERSERARLAVASGSACSGADAGVSGCVSVLAYLDDTIVGVPAELAGAAMPLAVDTFARAGHTVHPGKSACWSHSTAQDTLPVDCQSIWKSEGLKVGGIPVYNSAHELGA